MPSRIDTIVQTNGDLTNLTDNELADALAHVYREIRNAIEPTDDMLEALMFAENEVCDRAGIPLDETEQGLTENAAANMICEWISEHGDK